MRSCLCCSNRW